MRFLARMVQLQKLFKFLDMKQQLSDALRSALERELTVLSLPKNYMLLEVPKISDFAYFINEGSVMSFTFKEGKKQVEWMWTSEQVVISPKSFFNRVRSTEYLQLIEASEVVAISYQSVMRIFLEHPEAHALYRMVMSDYYDLCRQRIRDFQQFSGADRYKILIASFKNIEQVLSQELISSYLGITPQSLSRIKRRHP
jgi:CRP-like cAMP-binding protein